MVIKPLAIFCGYRARLVSDLVGNHDDRFSQDGAYMVSATWIKRVPCSKSTKPLVTVLLCEKEV